MSAAPEPTPEQVAAIAARDRDVFLEAGAGTGKTRVLVDRYCEAVCSDGVEVEAILAFTFTERAAAELRERVRRSLASRARDAREAGDLALAAELSTHARATERAWVTTIHGFCRRLLSAHPVAAGLDPRFRVLDRAEAARLRERAFAEALAELMEDGGGEITRAAASYRPYRLAEMTFAAHERLRSQGMAEPRLPPVSDAIRSPNPEKPGDPDDPPARLTPAEVEAATRARAALEALLEGFHTRYEQLKGERSGLDFADLELRALALLRDSPAVHAAWQERFAHILVDEFQDTNRVQLDLIEELRGPQARLFCVGDEHQSIYRFRNADLQVFRSRREEARSDAETEVLALRGNFRSRPAPLGAVNEIGSSLLTGFRPLTWGRPVPESGPPGGTAELLLTQNETTGDAPRWKDDEIDLEGPPSESQPAVVAEARFLARRLRELVDAGEAERGDIVVLLRAFTHVDAYEEALARAGLDPYVVGGRGYWSQQQVEDLVRLLGCVSNPLDDELLFGALASPAATVSPDALWLLRRAAGTDRHIWPVVAWRYGDSEREPAGVEPDWLDHVPGEDGQRLERFCAILAPLRAEAPLLGLEALVERVMSAFSYDLAVLALPGGRGRMANVRKLMRLAHEFELHEGRDLAAFLLAAAESASRDEREGMAPVRAEGHDGVRVMTVHAAKGLQFPVVAVPDLGRRLSAGHSWSDIIIGPMPRGSERQRFGMRLAFPSADSLGLWELVGLNQEERDAAAEEGCRLVYVAATRAEDRLILSGAFKGSELAAADEEKASDSPLRRLLPHLAEGGWEGGDVVVALPAPARASGAGQAPALSTTELRVSVNRPAPDRAEWLRERILAPSDATAPIEGGPPPLPPERARDVPVGHLSYSALAEYERCAYRFYMERLLGVRPGAPANGADDAAEGGAPLGGEEEPADELVEPAPGAADAAARSRALGIGNATHAALEWSAANEWQEPGSEALHQLLAREGLDRDADALQRVAGAVASWLGSETRARLAGWRVRPEVPFVLPVGGTIVRGKIDLLAEGPGRERCVIDFKTDALHGRPPRDVARRYAAQREVYALAAAGGKAEAGVEAVHLFLESPAEPVSERFGPAELERAGTRLAGLIARIRGGAFAPTAEPASAICFGCPAAARLCPHPAWRPPALQRPGEEDGTGGELAGASLAQGTLFE